MEIHGDAKTIAGAFVKARSEMSATVAKDGTGNYGKYATLAAIVEATAQPFAKHGLAVIQEVSVDEHGLVVDTWIIHESGATMQFAPLPMPLGDRRPQAVGSAATYARRYALAAICGLAPDDDDAQAAQDATQKPHSATRTTQKGQSGSPVPKRTVDASTGEIQAVVAVPPVPIDNPWETDPTDTELAILGTWRTPADAQAWAVAETACANEHEARESFKKIVDAHGGRLTKQNVGAVYLGFLRRQDEKLLARQQETAN